MIPPHRLQRQRGMRAQQLFANLSGQQTTNLMKGDTSRYNWYLLVRKKKRLKKSRAIVTCPGGGGAL